MKKIVFIADNLEGGAARLAEDILLEWLKLKDRPHAALIHGGAINLPDDSKLEKIFVKRKRFITAHITRCMLALRQTEGSIIYNFTNFPIPNVFCQGKLQIILIHNAYLVTFPQVLFGKYPLKSKIRETIKRVTFYFLLFLSNKGRYLVQSNWMKKLLQNTAKRITPNYTPMIHILQPHKSRNQLSSSENFSVQSHKEREQTEILKELKTYWFYPAAFYPHKNHEFVLEVAKKLQDSGSSIKIVTTIDKSSPSSSRFLDKVAARGLEGTIINTQWLSLAQTHEYLQTSRGLFFPSTFESLGLPLLEARNLGKPIIAASTELNREITEGEAIFFDILDSNAAETVAQAMQKEIFVKSAKSMSFAKLNLVEAYVLTQIDMTAQFSPSWDRYNEQTSSQC